MSIQLTEKQARVVKRITEGYVYGVTWNTYLDEDEPVADKYGADRVLVLYGDLDDVHEFAAEMYLKHEEGILEAIARTGADPFQWGLSLWSLRQTGDFIEDGINPVDLKVIDDGESIVLTGLV